MKTIARVLILLLPLALISGCWQSVDPRDDPTDLTYSFALSFPDDTVLGFVWDGNTYVPQSLDSIPDASDISTAALSIEKIEYYLDSNDLIALRLRIRNVGPRNSRTMSFLCRINFSDGSHAYKELSYDYTIAPGELSPQDAKFHFVVGPVESIEFLQVEWSYGLPGESDAGEELLDVTGFYTFFTRLNNTTEIRG